MTSSLPLLPDHLRDTARLNWYLTQWCNYSCAYCPVLVYHKKSRSGLRPHAFDHHPVEDWLSLIDKVPERNLHLRISGGEPFLDRENFRKLLLGLAARKHIRTGISTNAFWDPGYFRDVPKDTFFLDAGFHPSQTAFGAFFDRLRSIRDAGFYIAVVNFVLAPENLDLFENAYDTLSTEGFFVQVSAMFPTGVYLSRDYRTDRELKLLVRHNTPVDLHFKLLQPPTAGRPCFYPAMSYYMLWDGSIQVACTERFQNAFKDGLPELPRSAVPCPRPVCIGCTDMYRALAAEELYPLPVELFTHETLARQVAEYRKYVRATMPEEEFQGELAYWKEQLAAAHEKRTAALVMPATAEPADPPPCDNGIAGYIDACNGGSAIEARAGDRVMIQGWAASVTNGAPLRELRLSVDGHPIASIREFSPRPDVASHFGRHDWLRSGWQTMAFLPPLKNGDYTLLAEGIDRGGLSGTLARRPVRILE